MKKVLLVIFLTANLMFSAFLTVSAEESQNDIKEFFITDTVGNSIYENPRILQNPKPGDEETIINNPAGANCAVVIQEYGINVPALKEITMTAEHARDTLDGAGYNIKYLRGPLRIQVWYAITKWIPRYIGGENKVFIYICGHGSGDTVYLRPWLKMTAGWLDTQIDRIGNKYSNCMVLVESCHSGSFVDDLSESNRVILTSSNTTGLAHGPWDGECYFSDAFFTYLETNPGGSIGHAWEFADEFVENIVNTDPANQGQYQNVSIEDSGNGCYVGNVFVNDALPLTDSMGEEDGNLALSLTLKNQDNNEEETEMPISVSNLNFNPDPCQKQSCYTISDIYNAYR